MKLKKILSLVFVVLFCVTIFSGCGEENKNSPSTTTEIGSSQKQKSIVVVGGNGDEGFWQNFKKGGQEAAKKYGFSFDYMGTDERTESVVASHISSVGKAINQGASGLVVAPNGEGYSEIYGRLFEEKIPVVQLDDLSEDDFERLESNKENPIVSVVATDNKQAGAICAEKLFEKVKDEIKKSKNQFLVGVIEREDSHSDEEKTKGFIEKFTELADADPQTKDKYKVETESETRYEDSFDDLIQEDVKTVFITHPAIADKISDIVSAELEKYSGIIFCGFDSGAKQLKWLAMENGAEFVGGIAQNSYDLGYNAVEQCIFAVEGKAVKEKIEIAGEWYDKQNVDKMKQNNMVFPK